MLVDASSLVAAFSIMPTLEQYAVVHDEAGVPPVYFHVSIQYYIVLSEYLLLAGLAVVTYVCIHVRMVSSLLLVRHCTVGTDVLTYIFELNGLNKQG